MIDRDGQFTWDEDNVFDGIRQDVSESVRKYRIVRNCHFANRGALTKDRGVKPLHASRIGSTGENTTGLLDCHFNNGTQILVAVNEGASNADAYTFDNTSRAWTAQSVSIANAVRPMMVMFADQLLQSISTVACDHSRRQMPLLAVSAHSPCGSPERTGQIPLSSLECAEG